MPPKKLSTKSSISGTKYVTDYVFACGNSVPIYDVTTMHGLNQILGHVKFNNREFGDVLYRGQAALYDSLTPSLFRAWNGRLGTLGRCDTLGQIINRMVSSDKIKGDLKLGYNKKANRYKVEGLLQHYGVPTKCIDLVDNHWVAHYGWGYMSAENKLKSTHITITRKGRFHVEDGNALIAAGTWHTLRSLETGTVILEMKGGAYEPMSEGDVMNV